MSLLKTNESASAKMKELSRELKKSDPSLKGFPEMSNQLDQSESLLIGEKQTRGNGLEHLVKLSIDRNELKKFVTENSSNQRQITGENQEITVRESVTSLN